MLEEIGTAEKVPTFVADVKAKKARPNGVEHVGDFRHLRYDCLDQVFIYQKNMDVF